MGLLMVHLVNPVGFDPLCLGRGFDPIFCLYTSMERGETDGFHFFWMEWRTISSKWHAIIRA